MNGVKWFVEVVGCKNVLVGECFVLEWSICVSRCGWSGSENVGLSNVNIGENLMFWKFKGFFVRFVYGGWVRV